jgi:hypothetical protein
MLFPDEPRIRARLLRWAMLHPDRYIAAALAEWSDEDLAAVIAADPIKVWRLRLCGYPRRFCWAGDIVLMAKLVDGDDRLLEALLGKVGARP